MLSEVVIPKAAIFPEQLLFWFLCRAGGRVSHHQLVIGTGDEAGQSTLRPVEPDGGGLPPGLGPAGHVGHLRQGLGATQDPPRQPARLLSLVRTQIW